MLSRTDLAMEIAEEKGKNIKVEKRGKILFNQLVIEKKEEEEFFKKEKGKYITLEFEDIIKTVDFKPLEREIVEALSSLFEKPFQNILVVGLGNMEITCDSIGPRVAEKIFATRHIREIFSKKEGFSELKSVAVIAPNVLGKTGIETGETIKGIIEKIGADAVIAIDALACRSISRLFKTIQFSSSGISPGAGVKNSRKELSFKTLGVPVIAVGIPTVVDAVSLAEELTGKDAKENNDLILTPKDADILCIKISEVIARAVNIFLQPEIDPEILFELV